jgi:hypothetical protein
MKQFMSFKTGQDIQYKNELYMLSDIEKAPSIPNRIILSLYKPKTNSFIFIFYDVTNIKYHKEKEL